MDPAESKRASLYLDSNILIYLAQPNSNFYDIAWTVLGIAEKRGLPLYTSSLAYAEYGLLKQADGGHTRVEKLLQTGAITEVPFGHAEAVAYAKLRADSDKKTDAIDAMHAAAAIVAGAGYIITNDVLLSKLKITGLSCVLLPEIEKVFSAT